jgi:hypothetical protein
MYIFLGVVALFILAPLLAYRFEKRMVWPYSVLSLVQPFTDNTSYGKTWINDAVDSGFSFLGWASDLKGSKYKISYAMMISRESDCFAMIGFGYVLNIPVQGTVLFTQTTDGHVYSTTDSQSLVELDLSHMWRNQLSTALSFAGLLERHRKLLADRGVIVQTFTGGRETEELKRLREQRYQANFRMGLIAFTDPLCEYWHYTNFGAIKASFINYWVGLLRRASLGRLFRSF